MVQSFLEIAKSPMNHDKNFMIATFYRDHCHAETPVRTIHVVALPIIARGSALG